MLAVHQKKVPPVTLSWIPDQSHSYSLNQGNPVNRVSTRAKKTPSIKHSDFFMVDPNMSLEQVSKFQNQEGDRRYYKVSKPNRGSVHLKIFPSKC